MHIWVLFFWLTSHNSIQPAMTTQEFGSRMDCVTAGMALQAEFGPDARFMCLEKKSAKKGKKK